MDFINKILTGDCLAVLKTLPDACIDTCVTSPPYFGLRNYGHDDQIGMEETPELFVSKMVEVFTEVKRVLKKEGTLWLNLGDSYSTGSGGDGTTSEKQKSNAGTSFAPRKKVQGMKPKDLIGIPWLVAFALRSSGWYLRQDIIWHKPNPMPESVTDRCTKSHEYIFLLSKSAKYYYDHEAIKKPFVDPLRTNYTSGSRSNGINPDRNDNDFAVRSKRKSNEHRGVKADKNLVGHSGYYTLSGELIGNGMANKRSVWTVNTMPYAEAHFATFPEELIVDCIKAGCPEGGIVLDPFSGAGTTALVASKLNRNYVGIELNPAYIAIAEKRLYDVLGIFHKAG